MRWAPAPPGLASRLCCSASSLPASLAMSVAAAPNPQELELITSFGIRVATWEPKASAPNRSSREGVQDGYAGWLVVGHVAGDHGEAVHQRRRGDLLIQRVLCMCDPQLPPYLRDLLIEWQDRVSVITGDRAEPTRKA